MSGWQFWLSTAAVLLISSALLAVAANEQHRRQVEQDAARELQLITELRRGALERYLRTAESEIRFWATNQGLLDLYHPTLQIWRDRQQAIGDASGEIRSYLIDRNPYPPGRRSELIDPGEDYPYRLLHMTAQPLLNLLVSERGYYDFFAITADGDVLYTIEKEDDIGTNLVHGPYRNSGLAEAFKRVIAAPPDSVVASDIARYQPSNNVPAMFMAAQMRDRSGTLTGVLAVQLPVERIAEVMRSSSGLGRTGETYLVGQDGTMRSDSRFAADSTVLEVQVDSSSAQRALAGESGVGFATNYLGKKVLSAFTHVNVSGYRWAVISEVEREELRDWETEGQSGFFGLLMAFNALGLWSAWYLRRATPAAELPDPVAGLDASMAVESS